MQTIQSYKKPFTCIGLATVGRNFFWYLNIPAAKLVATEEHITIHAATKKYVFEKSSGAIIWINSGIYLSNVEIEHAIKEYPKYIKFHIEDLDSVRENLKRLGFATR